MKKIFVVSITVAAMCVAFTGCGKKEEVTNKIENNNGVVSEQQQGQQRAEGELPSAFNGKVSEKFFKLLMSDKYYFKMSSEFEGTETTIEMAVDGNNIAMDMSDATGESFATLIKDGKSYMLDHTEKVAMYVGEVSKEDEQSQQVLENLNLTEAKDEDVVYAEGKELFKGKEYKYEEFKITEKDEAQIIRVYVEGDKVYGFKTIVGEESQEIAVLDLSKDIPEGMLALPTDYTVTDTSNYGETDLYSDPNLIENAKG